MILWYFFWFLVLIIKRCKSFLVNAKIWNNNKKGKKPCIRTRENTIIHNNQTSSEIESFQSQLKSIFNVQKSWIFVTLILNRFTISHQCKFFEKNEMQKLNLIFQIMVTGCHRLCQFQDDYERYKILIWSGPSVFKNWSK